MLYPSYKLYGAYYIARIWKSLRKNYQFQKVSRTDPLNPMSIHRRHQVMVIVKDLIIGLRNIWKTKTGNDRVKSECVEYRTNEYYNFTETVRKFRRAFGVSAIGQQILNLALFVLSGNFVRRIWRHSKICQSMQCQGIFFTKMPHRHHFSPIFSNHFIRVPMLEYQYFRDITKWCAI